MGRLFLESLPSTKIYKCKCCKVDLACEEDTYATHYKARSGTAYLFDKAVNITFGPAGEEKFNTGLHTVKDIYCNGCQQLLGWIYIKAHEENQKFKEGKYLLEIKKMLADW